MGSSDGTDTAVMEASDLTFPAADVDTELNPGDNNNFEVDPISSKVATTLDMKAGEIKAAEEREKEAQKKEALQTLKTTIVVSAVVVAVAGTVFAIVKKLRET